MLVLANGSDIDSVRLSASLPLDAMEVGNEYEFVVDAAFPEGVSASDAGVPSTLLQIDVPPSARLTGRVLREQKELARNEYMRAPFERAVKTFPARIGFTLIDKPGPEEAFHINVIAYVSSGSEVSARFMRRRLALRLSPGATAKQVEPIPSSWGGDPNLQLGDRAPDFTLPSADGTTTSLAQYLGKKNIVVTTYRAYW